MFELASRLKLRFDSERGQLSVEDLWDLPLSSGKVNLNDLAKGISRAIRATGEEDFVTTKSNANEVLNLKLNILKHIIKFRVEAADAKKRGEEEVAKKKLIASIIEKKKLQNLENMSIEELTKMLE